MNGFEEGDPCLGQNKENLSLQMANKLPDPVFFEYLTTYILTVISFCLYCEARQRLRFR
jgi:hypothetical protein